MTIVELSSKEIGILMATLQLQQLDRMFSILKKGQKDETLETIQQQQTGKQFHGIGLYYFKNKTLFYA